MSWLCRWFGHRWAWPVYDQFAFVETCRRCAIAKVTYFERYAAQHAPTVQP